MKPFKYTVAADVKDACRLLGETTLALAGGSGLLNLMKEHVLEPAVLVDLKKIPELRAIDAAAGRLGATATLAELIASKELADRYPALVQAAADIASPQIRNRTTVGGNLCARPACWYFAHESFSCAKKGGQGCPAKGGENEFHAIFDTGGPCVMVHPSSLAPALVALEATVEIAGPDAARTVPIEEFFVLPAKDMLRETALAPNEIVVAVKLGPARPRSATYVVKQRASHDWPVCLAAVALDLDSGTCRSARIALGGVAPTPRRATGAESTLAGKPINAQTAAAAAAAAVAGAQPLSQNAYKVAAARTAVKRALLLAGTGTWQ